MQRVGVVLSDVTADAKSRYDAFNIHVEGCFVCSCHPTDLCSEGKQLLERAMQQESEEFLPGGAIGGAGGSEPQG